MIRTLLTHPNKLLRKRSRDVRLLSGLRDIVGDAIDTMVSMQGSGIALVQIGIPLRVIVINCLGGRTITLVNPRIIFTAGEVLARESCLSLPGQEIRVQRHEYIRIEHLKPHGLDVMDIPDPIFAVAVQHEIDHLNGVLTLDRSVTNHSRGAMH